jgi:gas vesicle protein GvpL/GvpF
MNKQHFGVGLVHGFVATASRARLPQIADAFDAAEAIGVAAHQLALLISNVPQHFRGDLEADTLFSDPARISILAVAHHRILQAAAVVTDVVPIRLGALVTGPAGARDLLTREAGRFADHLAAIHDAVEFAVRILPARGPPRQASRMQAGCGRDYLRARRDERASSRPAVVDIVFHELALRAVAIRERQPSSRQAGQPPIADAAFLVNRRKLAAFARYAERIERQIAGGGLALDVFGPLPAYSFVDTRLEDQR